ncbi:MAG: ParA family protein [Deltaproteobacteria bacterium]|nr:ParA family protein [Deltaproteobacteria bacterium]
MRRVIAIANHKGGVGKTATAVNLAAALAEAGEGTLVVDLDPQGSASSWLGVEDEGAAALEAFSSGAALPVRPTGTAGVDLVASGTAMASAERRLAGEIGAERLLSESLARTAGPWTWVLVDCPPGLGLLSVNALAAATGVLVPVEAHHLGLRGLADSRRTVEAVRRRLNPALEIVGVLPCRAHGRRALHREVVELLESSFPGRVGPAIRETVALAEAPAHGVPVTRYAPRSHAAADYRRAAAWLRERVLDGGESARGEEA